jgi:capsular exopolysaccharide synthesis family protein
MIRTALLERLGDRKGHTIQITSAGPGAGKTTLAMLLGRSLTRCGKRVLLIDADLRNPGLGALLGVRREPGLIGVLRARVPDGTAIVGEPGGLNILPAGAIAGSEDPELLANGVLARCIKRWRDNYDVILFDGAPLLPVADARILSRQVDSNVMVVREEHCHRGDVAEALANLQSAGGKLGGVVFFTRHSRSAYPGSYYAGFYGYSSKRGGSDEPAGVA